MPRDASGVYTLPAGNPVIPNTIIATNWANSTMEDIAAALTASLSIDGSVTTAKLANSAVTTAKLADGAVTRAKLSADIQNDILGRNYFVNGAAQVWQAATTLGGGTGVRYSADMFRATSAGTTYSVTQAAFAVGQTDVDPQAQFAYNIVVSSVAGAGNFCLLALPVESVRTLAGKQVTLSFYARRVSGMTNIAVEFTQEFGGGGSVGTSTYVAQVSPTTSWARYSVTTTIPNINGKIIGTAPHALVANIWFDAGSNFNARTGSLGQQSGEIQIWGIKIEEGPAMTPFEVPTYEETYSACCRYYWAPPFDGTSAGPITYDGDCTATRSYFAYTTYPTQMMFIPTVQYVEGTSSNFPVGATISATTTTGVRILKTCSGTGKAFYFGTLIVDGRI